MEKIREIAPDIFRISTFLPEVNMQMNQFLVRDEEPLLWHTGQRFLFEEVLGSVAKLIDLSTLRWIGFSHFEADECGALNEWMQIAPEAQAFCSDVCAGINMNDFAVRPVVGMLHDDRIGTGKFSFRFLSTPHLPHGWDAGLLFEETNRVLFSSDILYQSGNPAGLVESDIVGVAGRTLVEDQNKLFTNPIALTHRTEEQLKMLGDLVPRTLAVMHGSSYRGNCPAALREFGEVLRNVVGPKDSTIVQFQKLPAK